MELYYEEGETVDGRVFRTVLRMQNITRVIDYGYVDDDDSEDDFDSWQHGSHGYPRFPNRRLAALPFRTPPSYVPTRYLPPACNTTLSSSVRDLPKESDAERKARLLEETKKSKEKAEKKRLKKQKQKQRKLLEKLEKEKLNPIKKEKEDNAEKAEAQENKDDNGEYNDNRDTNNKLLASGKDPDASNSSENESSEEDRNTANDSDASEELDMTSTFVNKAAQIAKRKMDQNRRPETKEKQKIPNKNHKTISEKNYKDQEVTKPTSASAPPSHTTEQDNVKISTDLGLAGNKFASAGDYNMAVRFFTDAIKYNPTEFKLFGNRSFCFEKLQEYEKALTDAELSLGIYPGWVKGLFRKGRALAGLKRYQEAAQTFMDVLKLDSQCAEAAQELMRVQIIQLMEYGFTREQSSNALIIHGTVEKALEVLSKLNPVPGTLHNGTVPPVQVANVTGVSPVLSANKQPTAAPAQPQDTSEGPQRTQPLVPVQNVPKVQSQPTKTNNDNRQPPPELFPVWVGNLNNPVFESVIANLFSKVGAVYSVKVLSIKRCAFVNFTKQEHCDEAIKRFHGSEVNGNKIVVRYPDRIPAGMGISKSALKADSKMKM
ncbi:uncharacterized protein KZ484_019986 [Pholidichthys leucotaenia]